MADRQFDVSILLGCVDTASGVLVKTKEEADKLNKQVSEMGTAFTAVGAAVTAAYGLIINSAAECELAHNRLASALENNGYEWEDAKYKVDDFVNSEIILTAVSEDALIPALQKMMIYTSDLATAQENVKIAVDMAATGFWDLETAIRLVGMAADGNVEILGRYIPELRAGTNAALDNMDASEKAAYALEILRQKFGNMAANELLTFSGSFRQLTNTVGELGEDIGNVFLPELTETAKQFNSIVLEIREWVAQNPELTKAIAQTVVDLGATDLIIGTLIISIPELAKVFTSLNAVLAANPAIAVALAIEATVAGLTNLGIAWAEQKDKINASDAALAQIIKEYQELQHYMKEVGDTTNETGRRHNIFVQDYLANAIKLKYSGEDFLAMQDRVKARLMEVDAYYVESNSYHLEWLWNQLQNNSELVKAYENMFDHLKSATSSYYTYVKMMTDTDKNNKLTSAQQVYLAQKDIILTQTQDEKEMNKQLLQLDNDYAKEKVRIEQESQAELAHQREALKPLLIAEALAEGALAIIKTLAEYGGTPIGWAAAALIGIETAVQVATINAQKFAGGVRGFGGGLALVGEEGPELVSLPGGSNVYTNRETGEMLSGGGPNIYITDNHFYGTGGLDELADKIGEVIFGRVKNQRYV